MIYRLGPTVRPYGSSFPSITHMPESGKPSVTAVIAVYNNPLWLRLILDALRQQTFKNFEVAIADDGSNEENVAALRAYMADHPELRIIHAWHEDKGWRKNIALNNALRKSSGEYVVFIDGDCIPHPRFIEDHYRLRKKGVVTGGRRIESSETVTKMIESWTELPQGYFRKIRGRVLRDIFKEKFSRTLAQLRRSWRFPFIAGRPLGIRRQGILGANFGIFREDLERINGFDERYLDAGTGEDCDLDARLENAGIQHVKASHYALMAHRCHKRLDWSSEHNAELLRKAREEHLTYISTGLRREAEDNE